MHPGTLRMLLPHGATREFSQPICNDNTDCIGDRQEEDASNQNEHRGTEASDRAESPAETCLSRNQRELCAAIGIHFMSLKNIDKPVVWVFPRLLVRLDCGFTEIVIPEAQRQEVKDLDSYNWRVLRKGV